MADKSLDPSTASPAHADLAPKWAMIRAIIDGADSVRNGKTTYLPKYPAESDLEYSRRLASAPWRPEFEDALRSISSKPFSKEVTLAGKPSEEVKKLAEDIDGRGNNLHVFAKTLFEDGVSLGASGILVDFPPMSPNATMADERAQNARPYWVEIAADEIIALRTERRGAREVVTHLRVWESAIVVDGFEETTERKIRVLEPGLWQLWREVEGTNGAKRWEIETEGAVTLNEVPFVFYATADRIGSQYVRPPLLDLATMQIELYRFMSSEEQIYTVAGSPMLTANGMGAPDDGDAVETGPGRILYAPGAEGIQTSWEYIQPDAQNLKAISEKANSIIEDIRRLGLQPMLPKTGNVTATATGVEAAKAHTAVGTWANGLRDALEQAWVFTMRWLGSSETIEVTVNTDFGVALQGAEEVRELREARAASMISEDTFWDEMVRRGVLGPQFDKEEERKRLLEEVPGDDGEDDILAATTMTNPGDGRAASSGVTP